MNRAMGIEAAMAAKMVTVAAVVMAAGLAACTGSLFTSKAAPPTVYLLSAPAPAPAPAQASAAAATPAAAADLAVLRPKLRPGLESDRIAVLYPDRRLDYFADARWSGPLGEVLQYFAMQEFHSRAHLRTVSGDASVFASAYWLEIEVTDFQAEYTSASSAPTVHARFLARIGSSGDRHILGQFAADAEQPAADNRLTAIVDAYARAADAALSKIVADADATLASQKFDSPAASAIR
jgi:cholesterol transport system auxiliary component